MRVDPAVKIVGVYLVSPDFINFYYNFENSIIAIFQRRHEADLK